MFTQYLRDSVTGSLYRNLKLGEKVEPGEYLCEYSWANGVYTGGGSVALIDINDAYLLVSKWNNNNSGWVYRIISVS